MEEHQGGTGRAKAKAWNTKYSKGHKYRWSGINAPAHAPPCKFRHPRLVHREYEMEKKRDELRWIYGFINEWGHMCTLRENGECDMTRDHEENMME